MKRRVVAVTIPMAKLQENKTLFSVPLKTARFYPKENDISLIYLSSVTLNYSINVTFF